MGNIKKKTRAKFKSAVAKVPLVKQFVEYRNVTDRRIAELEESVSFLRQKVELGEKKEKDLEDEEILICKNVKSVKRSLVSVLDRLGRKKTIAFTVTDDGSTGIPYGDIYTAHEMGEALEKRGYQIEYLSRFGKNDWYNVGLEVDILIVLLDDYDLTKIYGKKDNLITIAWIRNNTEYWPSRSRLDLFDIVLASSNTSCKYLSEHSCRKDIKLFPIATNPRNFYSSPKVRLSEAEKKKYTSDVAFTGSYWPPFERKIMKLWTPEDDKENVCKIYGANWEQYEPFRSYSEGIVNYEDMLKIYQNTKIVLDDATMPTIKFGAVNSRVFDALASGTLVITDGVKGAEETFCGMLPTFSSKEELNKKIEYFLKNDTERKKVAKRLQDFVLKNHTYDIRAEELDKIVREYIDVK